LKTFLFVDLDDTLFQTPIKVPNAKDLEPVAYLKSGDPISYTTAKQRALFTLLNSDMTLIPTTARNHDALSRVDLPFASYSIIDFGGVVLKPDGSVDEVWADIIRADMAQALAGLHAAMDIVDNYAASTGLKARARLVEDCGTPFYIVVKDPDKQAGNLELIEREAVLPWLAAINVGAGSDFCVHRNANNLAILPKTLNKARAVAYVRQILEAEHGEIITFGMGDSTSDARFMASCDYAIIPKGSQLAAHTVETL
jgi:hydroxymethylpyrimidine pyrophosphatase-like HAD family hydrolase